MSTIAEQRTILSVTVTPDDTHIASHCFGIGTRAFGVSCRVEVGGWIMV
jgi:hypothetical protein